MPTFNKAIVMGNLTRDPELRHLPNNMAVCDIGLAINEKAKNKNTGESEEKPVFVDCTAFGKTAENIQRFFTKGRPIFIEGKLRFEQWEDRQTGQKRSKLKVVIDQWQFVDSDPSRSSNGSSQQSAGYSAGRGGNHKPLTEEEIPW